MVKLKLKNLIQFSYYRYLFFQLKRIHIKDYLFIDIPTVLISFIFVIANIIFFFSGKLSFHFPKLDIEIFIIETLLRTMSIFIGIIFSFIVLSFNIFYRYFGRFVFLNFFKNRSIKILFTLFVTTIVFMIYSLSYLKEINISDNYSNSLFILSIVFCSVTIFAIFPAIIFLLRESQNRENIKTLINQLNIDWAISYHENVLWDKSATYKHYQKDLITLLTEIGTVAIKEFDQTTINTIVDGCIEHLENSIKQEKRNSIIEPRELFYEFRTLISNLFQVAIKERNENALFHLIRSRFEIESLVLKNINRVQLFNYNNKYWGWELNNDTQDYFNRVIQFNEDEVCRRIIDLYRDHITEIIKTVLPERNYDYDSQDLLKFMDETSMISGKFSVVDFLSNSIITSKKNHLFQNISNLYSTLDLVSIDSANTRNSKIFLLHIINIGKFDNLEKYIYRSDIRDVSYLTYPFHISTNQAIDEIECTIPFKGSLKAIDMLFVNEKLNNVVINSLKANILHFLDNFEKKEIYKNLIVLSVNKFDHIRSLIPEESNNYQKDIYLKLEEHLSFLLEYAKGINIKDKKIVPLIRSNVKLFVFKEKFKKELDKKGYISNDRIV